MAQLSIITIYCDGCRKNLYKITVEKDGIVRDTEPKPLYCAKCAGMKGGRKVRLVQGE